MSITITKPRTHVDAVAYSRSFEWRDMPGAGFGFDCDANGVIAPLNPVAAESLRKCLSGENDVIDRGIEERRWTYTIPAEGRCVCGRTVALDGDTDCDCGRIYNGAGQELAPRHMWGDDTGETFGSWVER